jgi:hypothetical protein
MFSCQSCGSGRRDRPHSEPSLPLIVAPKAVGTIPSPMWFHSWVTGAPALIGGSLRRRRCSPAGVRAMSIRSASGGFANAAQPNALAQVLRLRREASAPTPLPVWKDALRSGCRAEHRAPGGLAARPHLRSPRERVRAGGGDQALRHPVVDVAEAFEFVPSRMTPSYRERR